MSRLRRATARLAARSAYKFLLQDWLRPDDLDAAADLLATMRWVRQLEPVVMERPDARRIQVMAPHPDDEMIGPGGTLLRSIDAGADVDVLVLTSEPGEKGALRRRESEAVAAWAGYRLTFLDLPSGSHGWADTAVPLVQEHLRAHPADVLLLPFVLDDHPDHREANRLLALTAPDAVLPAEVWAYQVYTPLPANVVVDITEVHARKAEGIRMWRDSAMRSRDWAHFALGLNAFNSRLLAGVAEARYVESFFVLPTDEYRKLCARYFGAEGN